MFVHCVYFWLNDGVPAEERRVLMNDCEDILSEIPTVRHIWSGTPADRPRDVVDSSYDVGLCVVLDECPDDFMQRIAREANLSETTFPTVVAADRYLSHPASSRSFRFMRAASRAERS